MLSNKIVYDVRFHHQYKKQHQLTLHWDLSVHIVSEYLHKWYLFWDSLFKRRTDGALVRLEMPLRRGQSVEEAQAVMDSFTRHLMKILPEYVPG